MRNIKLLLSYDGTPYSGWQRQAGSRSVQGEIENALAKLHKRHVALAGSGRTDAGVHAAGQCASFYTDIDSIEAPRFVPALNGLLPPDIRILEATEAPEGFHARFDAKARLYRYFFICGRPASPAEHPFTVSLHRRPDLLLLNAYARVFHGEMDCALFAASGDRSKSKNRYLFYAYFFMEAGKLVFEIKANAFLWKMVRSAAGTMLFYEEQGLDCGAFYRIVRSGRRELAGPTLPPRGLFLWRIEY